MHYILQVLGIGSTSTCYKCIERATGKAYACKTIDKRTVDQKFRGLLEQFHIEISVSAVIIVCIVIIIHYHDSWCSRSCAAAACCFC
jgi:Protein kinase domain